jgi:Protein of unknown function (DUF3106)
MPPFLKPSDLKLHLILSSCFLLGALLFQTAQAQTAQPVATPPASSDTTGPLWSALNIEQKTALRPLEASWNGLTGGQRRKWVVVAQNFKNLTPDEQTKIHGRMVDWAALSPRDREQARLNFAQTKAVSPADRAATWEAYQALSPEERKALAAQAPKKPQGAALAIKPVAPDKLAPVPVTRLSPADQRSAVAAKKPIDRNTLLPLPESGETKSDEP